jgi:hypothetical protein
MKLKIHSLTSDLWPALEELFGKLGACNGCWCMYWRICPAYRKQDREVNKAAFRQIVGHGPPPGLIAFDGEVPVGWCQLTPRNALPWLDRVWRLSALIAAAVTIAKMAGASALEAYPLAGDSDIQRVVDQLRFDLCTGWVQGRCAPHAAAPDHAS